MIRIENLNISFKIQNGKLDVLSDINLDITKGEFVCIIGASGCGKSTLLRVIAGLEPKFEGVVEVGGKPVIRPGTDRGVVFQEPRLFNWLSTAKNIGFGLPAGTPKEKVKSDVDDIIKLVGLEGFGEAYPHQLSGGMQQRASIARALIPKPDVLLLDEPFGALDAFTRMNMQNEVLKIWDYEKTTMILVTHDIDEAVYLADRVVVLSRRPGSVKRVITNPLPRPRKRVSKSYQEIRTLLYQQFFSEFESDDIEYNL